MANPRTSKGTFAPKGAVITSADQKVAMILNIWRKDPLLAMKQMFGVTPDPQQAELILKACVPGARIAAKSAQGAGKTSTLTWLTLYFLLTLEDCRILITSPSYQQLSRVFHSEILKWLHKMPEPFRTEFFEVTRDRINIKGKPYQMANLVTASADNEESLQGGHSENYIILADEASAIEEPIFDVLQGTLGTGSGGRFIMTANPIRNSGRFYDVFSRDLKAWDTLTLSAFESGQIKESWIEEMKDFYGEDSDRYRVRVLAEFPRAGEEQFIPVDIVDDAMGKLLPPSSYMNYPKICGVDVARFGSDLTVFTVRQGPKLLDITEHQGLDTSEVAGILVDYYHKHLPENIFIDAIGIGAGVYDQAKRFGLPVHEVVVSTKSSDPKTYFNLRSQLWGEMRSWLHNGAAMPTSPKLKKQLTAMTYSYNNKLQIQLANKKDLKKQGLESPDIPDSLSLTFAPAAHGYNPAKKRARKVRKSNYVWA